MENEEIAIVAQENKLHGEIGQLKLQRMKMFVTVDSIPGFMKVFPNYKHENRKDGFGCSALSPKKLGPIHFNGLEANNLENFWQFAKVFPCEYKDEKQRKKMGITNKPLFSVYLDKDGKERKYSYVESRYFYCRLYADLVRKEEKFIRLQNLLKEGYNLLICGYDAYPMEETFSKYYLDESLPFGHERVLYCLLKDEEPWERYKEEHPELYVNMF